MSSSKIALLTCSKFPKLTRDDSLLVKPLQNAGFEPVAAAWDDKKVDWSRFEIVIMRSGWNYHLKYPQFLEWLDLLEKLKIEVWNPIETLRWNSNKKYLRDLADKRVTIIPSVWIEKGEIVDLENISREKGWSEFIIKPTVGASAYEIFRADKNNFSKVQPQIDKMLSKSDVMIQPVMREVLEEGEYSIVAIGGKYSHTVLKRPKKGDFRSNWDFGATQEKVAPDQILIDQALNILKKVDSPTLYARIDGINQNGKFILMELELIEPELFFGYEPESAEAFAQSLKDRLV
jgi:glutathione synthase/RimK-type ligase-like ATP-grasp enzyme